VRQALKGYLTYGDHLTSLLFLALLVAGSIMVHSATTGTKFTSLAPRQTAWCFVAAAVYLLATLIPYDIWIEYSYILYGLCVVVLVAVMLFGHAVAGSRSWLILGPVGFQPSEFAKVAAALAGAGYLKDLSQKVIGLREFGVLCAIIGLPMVLTLVEPDFGTATTFLPMVLAAFFLSRLSLGQILKWAGVAIVAGAVLFVIGWFTFFKPYQKERILTFVNPGTNLRGAGYQVHQARIAVGSGEVTGKGLNSGTQNRLNFLPAPHTDFVFGVIAEETGFVGSMALLAVFLALLARFAGTILLARDLEGRFLVCCAFAVIMYHLVINVGMVIGLVPTTGIPLPFISYGGSSLIGLTLFVGLAANVRAHRFVR
jgi:rod shape determining protein RodA